MSNINKFALLFTFQFSTEGKQATLTHEGEYIDNPFPAPLINNNGSLYFGHQEEEGATAA